MTGPARSIVWHALIQERWRSTKIRKRQSGTTRPKRCFRITYKIYNKIREVKAKLFSRSSAVKWALSLLGLNFVHVDCFPSIKKNLDKATQAVSDDDDFPISWPKEDPSPSPSNSDLTQINFVGFLSRRCYINLFFSMLQVFLMNS